MSLANLTLDDLFSDKPLDPKKLPQPKHPSREEREATIAAAAAAARKTRFKSPWKSSAVTLFIQRITCTCSATHTAPASEGLLVEFTHKRNPATKHYVANHPSIKNPTLPRNTEYIDSECSSCPECFSQVPSTPASFQYEPIHKDKTLPKVSNV